MTHPDPTAATPAAPKTPAGPLRLRYHAVSDVGRVRKDNQDSGYAGPWLLAVCDGVGGAARGDIASSTAIGELRQLDEPPGGIDLLARLSDGMHEAHDSIGSQVDHDPALNGTSTTATVGLFDGQRLAVGHVGDSRAYLLRDGELSQLTNDHTFVQSLIDEGRITEAEARVHPHRNLILKALDGLHEVEPDLFALELVPGDQLFLCSDGACGVLDDDRIARILRGSSPEFAAVEMVRASLDAGSSDNVTCVVADVITAEQAEADPTVAALQPEVVGAAAELKRRMPRALFRGHRSGDTGELEPVDAEIPEGIDFVIQADPPVDPEAYRYAPRAPRRYAWARRLLALALLVGIGWSLVATGYWWTQRQYYVGESDGYVAIYRGVDGLPRMSSVYQTSDLAVDDLSEEARLDVEGGIAADNLEDAAQTVNRLAERMVGDDTDDTEGPTPTAPTDVPSDEPSQG
ncbi:protein phosphatase 2C domain-containing protein [Nocardioides sp. YIM 152588]|uniref:PP2C family protein-serine/threonine phosphatase n=1 Tax=Nocardioides sp. YIM 152588 TaxID=3158259 RepID=UPI0032E3AAAF